uniref:Protein kinase domain-containing protein n=1 Tax=Parascaris univalens TaxID=6257 RepID=A0A915CGS2_PARUN
MVGGLSSPLKDSVINGCYSENSNSETDEKEPAEEAHIGTSQRERGHITNGAAARRWLIVMEPISALSIACTLGAKGRIFRVDDSLATLLGYVSMSQLLGTEIGKLIPAVNLDADGEEQHVCALGVRGNSIPITVRIATEWDPKTKNALMYELQIRALSAVNGVITLTESGVVHSFNENFIEALVGKQCKDQALQSLIHITDIIPKFHSHIHTCETINAAEDANDVSRKSSNHLNPSFEECQNWPTSSTPMRDESSASNSAQLTAEFGNMSITDTDDLKCLTRFQRVESDLCSMHPSTSACTGYHKTNSKDGSEEGDEEKEEVSPCRVIREGTFYGLAKHSDANMIAVRFDVRRLESGCPANWAVCIGYDRSADFGLFGNTSHDLRREDCSSVDLQGTLDEDDSSKNEIKFKRSESSTLACVSLQALEDENAEAVCGEYSQHYDTFQLIGNGAFGSVKLAARKDNGFLAVAKFICKAKVLPEGWVPSPKRGNRMVPIELHLLETLSHPHIVKALDVYENETYYQLVMEKLGCGMDLFEFIDHQPKLDEPLISYIFRQIVSALAYLHASNIVHRDVKDENVIIDQNFCCKLIDFGSAAYFGKDIVFSTFCGTMEYCSPEVLSGNKYRGPELEMWSLGILLYTLVYFENPFRSPQETVQAEIELPWDVSDGLFQVIAWLLQRDPRLRATVDDIKNHWWITQPVDIRRYKFQDMLKTCERAQIDPPLYVSELANHLKNASSCSALVINVPSSHSESNTFTIR